MSGKRVFITGAEGMLGSALMKHLKGYTLTPSITDITDKRAISEELKEAEPDIVIHTAGYTDVDGCEREPKKAFRVNTIGTQNIVNYAIGRDVTLIYISSTGIYGDHKRGNYTEFDRVEPTTIHHRSKYEGEKIVRDHLSKSIIVRTGWLYGGEKEDRKNFVYRRFLEAKGRDFIYSDNSQIGNPTHILDLIYQIDTLIKNREFGTFNCVNGAKGVSRLEYVSKIVELFNIDCRVEPAPKEMFKRDAPVSPNESAENYKLELMGLNVMRGWEEALKSYIEEIKGG